MPYATKELQTAKLDDISRVRSKVVTTDYTFALADANTVIEVNSASNLVLTIPPDSVEPFPIGTIIGIYRHGTGAVTINGGSGTMRSEGGSTSTRSLASQYSEASLRLRAVNDWVLAGDLT